MKLSGYLVDPQLREYFDDFPSFELNDASVGVIRKLELATTQLQDRLPVGITRDEITMPGFDGLSEVQALIYKPSGSATTAGAYLHIHGGGLVIGTPANSDAANIEICLTLGIVVLSVYYRLAPEHPFPAALHDCYSALAYLHCESEGLGIDTRRIAVGGESAGGGLAASLAIFAREKREYSICHQQLVYPMLDATTGINGAPLGAHLGEYCWTRDSNVYSWNAYLAGRAAVDAYVPAATVDLADLPPAWVGVGDLDLFFPENRSFAKRLSASGVDVAIDIYPGAPHGFTAVAQAQVTKRFKADFLQALAHGLQIDT
jgi:acetyl esterase/lipase